MQADYTGRVRETSLLDRWATCLNNRFVGIMLVKRQLEQSSLVARELELHKALIILHL
jgi:hypothetical protein